MGIYDETCTEIHPSVRVKSRLELQKVNGRQELMQFSLKQSLHCSGLRKASCVQVWGFAQGALTLLCPPTQVFYCSQERCPVHRQARNLSVICRGDCHRVGRLGRSASPHTDSRYPPTTTTTNCFIMLCLLQRSLALLPAPRKANR